MINYSLVSNNVWCEIFVRILGQKGMFSGSETYCQDIPYCEMPDTPVSETNEPDIQFLPQNVGSQLILSKHKDFVSPFSFKIAFLGE